MKNSLPHQELSYSNDLDQGLNGQLSFKTVRKMTILVHFTPFQTIFANFRRALLFKKAGHFKILAKSLFHTHFRVKFYHSKMCYPPFNSFTLFVNLCTCFQLVFHFGSRTTGISYMSRNLKNVLSSISSFSLLNMHFFTPFALRE